MKRSLGLFPLPDPPAFGALLSELAEALRTHGFAQTDLLPLPGALRHAFFDPGSVVKYIQGQQNTHEVAWVAPLLYRDFARKHAAAEQLFEAFTLRRPTPVRKIESLLGVALTQRLLDLQM